MLLVYRPLVKSLHERKYSPLKDTENYYKEAETVSYSFGVTMKLLNKGHSFCKAFVAIIHGWPLLRGFILLKITGLHSCHLALIQGVALVQESGGGHY